MDRKAAAVGAVLSFVNCVGVGMAVWGVFGLVAVSLSKVYTKMIEEFSTSESILNELAADTIQADFWFQKECGGRKSLQRLMDRLSKRAGAEQRTLISNVSEYKSPRGNRWLVYLQVSPSGEADTPRWVRLCVAEGADGPLVYLFLTDKCGRGYATFTPRFFVAYAEQLGYLAHDPAVMAHFMLDLRVSELRIEEPDEEECYPIQWGLQHGVATGQVDSFQPYVIKVTDYWPGNTVSETRPALRPQSIEQLRKGSVRLKAMDPRTVMMTNFLVALLNKTLMELSVSDDKRMSFFSMNQSAIAVRVNGLLKEWHTEDKGLHLGSLVRIFREFEKRAGLKVDVADDALMEIMERLAKDMYVK